MKYSSLIVRGLALCLLVGMSAPTLASSDEVRTVTRLGHTSNAPGSAEGKTDLRIKGSRIDFKVEVSGIPAGPYDLIVDGVMRGVIDVRSDQFGTFGEIEFRNTTSSNKIFLDFDPDGATVEIAELNGTVVFTSILADTGAGSGSDDGPDGPDDSDSGSGSGSDDGPDGPDDSGSGSGSGSDDSGSDDSGSGSGGNSQSEDRIKFHLTSTGAQPRAAARTELRIRSSKTKFKVRIKRVEVGTYDLFVDGENVGTFQATLNSSSSSSSSSAVTQSGRRSSRGVSAAGSSPSAEGEIDFRDPIGDNPGVHLLTFDPRGKVVEVRRGSVVILSGLFPGEGAPISTSNTQPSTGCNCTSDLNGDGIVDTADMNILLADFGQVLVDNQPLPIPNSSSRSRSRSRRR